MKRLAILLFAVSMTAWASGCCGWWPCSYGGCWGAGYPGLCPGGACPPAGGPVGPSTYSPTGMYDGSSATQSQYNQVTPASVAAAPIWYGGTAQTAQAPLESLPTYH